MNFPLMLRSTHKRILASCQDCYRSQVQVAVMWRNTAADLQAEVDALKKELHDARKNDARDPDTGRYVKAPE